MLNKNIIVIDTETTGLSFDSDLLQVSIIDGYGKTLFDSYMKPIHATEWKEAEAVNGISPEMVKDLPTIEYYKEQIQDIIDTADVIIGYNVNFDLGILGDKGITFEDKQISDVMLDFAEIYGEWNEYYQNYKWQKLTKCADYYGYQWEEDAHNSLGDVKATLYCYKKMQENKDLANILYNYCLDMDYADSMEFADEEINQLAKEINTIKKAELNCLLCVIETVAHKNSELKDWIQKRITE